MLRGGFVQKKCPRCGGNVFLDVDEYGWLEKCLQCSYTCDLGKIAENKKTSDTEKTVEPIKAPVRGRREKSLK